jgi:hypothetical protein
LGLPVFQQVASGYGKASFLKKKRDTSHADTADSHEVDFTARLDLLFCKVYGVHGYSPATFSSRSANRLAAFSCARFFMALLIRTRRLGFSETLIR